MNDIIIDKSAKVNLFQPKISKPIQDLKKQSKFDDYLDRKDNNTFKPSSSSEHKEVSEKNVKQSSGQEKASHQDSKSDTKSASSSSEKGSRENEINAFIIDTADNILSLASIGEEEAELSLDAQELLDTDETALIDTINLLDSNTEMLEVGIPTLQILQENQEQFEFDEELLVLGDMNLEEGEISSEQLATAVQATLEDKNIQIENLDTAIDVSEFVPEDDIAQVNVNTQSQTQTVQFQKQQEVQVLSKMPLNDNITVTVVKDPTNSNKIGINLEPAGMGEVELVIENNKENAVIAVLRSDKPEILDQLRKEAASLEKLLTDAGLDLGGNGLGFEQKSGEDANQSNNSSGNETLTATLAEERTTSQSILAQDNSQSVYDLLEKQAANNNGIDIRL